MDFELGGLAWICMCSLWDPGGGWSTGGSLKAERPIRICSSVQQRDDVQADGGWGEMEEGKFLQEDLLCWLGERRTRGQGGEEAFQRGLLGFNPLDKAFPWIPL